MQTTDEAKARVALQSKQRMSTAVETMVRLA